MSERKLLGQREFNGSKLSIRELPTEANHERTYHVDLIAPEDLATTVVTVPAGTTIPVDISVRSLTDGVLFEADATVQIESECVRCLDPISTRKSVKISEMFFTPEAIERMRDEHGDEGVEDLRVLEGDEIELETLLRDNIVSGFPFQPLCQPDCDGLCDVCGEKWKDLPEDHAHEMLDPRFAKLSQLLQDGKLEDESK
ncbi:MAG: YceD family protein [Actinomycetaceae bacterium]|nr:YceD family protein [Actinomycetaceae bacterium]